MNALYAAPRPTSLAAAHPWQAHTAQIQRITTEGEGVLTYQLGLQSRAARAAYRFAPGQFNMLYVPGAGEIAISISENPRNLECCAHTVRIAGNVTRTLAGMSEGQTLGLRGPFGTSWPLAECIGRDVVLVAGGIGLAPLRPVIYSILNDRRQFGRISLLCGARSPDSLLYAREYDAWTQQGVIVHTTVDRSAPGWLGNVGVVTLLLERLRTFDPRNTVLLCCGPEVMMKFTAMTAINRGLSPSQLWVSLERNMQCAVGLCGHCQLGPAFVCKDGPVFRFDQIHRWMEVEAL
jgi:NAD(P)H-flavin reductase